MLIGVISDTHGLMRPEALRALAGSQLIIHAGDIGDPGILDALRKIAPVVAVRGNIDTASALPESELIEQEGKSIYILHDVNQLDLDPGPKILNLALDVLTGPLDRPVVLVHLGGFERERFLSPLLLGLVGQRPGQFQIEQRGRTRLARPGTKRVRPVQGPVRRRLQRGIFPEGVVQDLLPVDRRCDGPAQRHIGFQGGNTVVDCQIVDAPVGQRLDRLPNRGQRPQWRAAASSGRCDQCGAVT